MMKNSVTPHLAHHTGAMMWLATAWSPVLTLIRRRRARHAQLRQLEGLLAADEHLLRDMGVTRQEVRWQAIMLSRLFH